MHKGYCNIWKSIFSFPILINWINDIWKNVHFYMCMSPRILLATLSHLSRGSHDGSSQCTYVDCILYGSLTCILGSGMHATKSTCNKHAGIRLGVLPMTNTRYTSYSSWEVQAKLTKYRLAHRTFSLAGKSMHAQSLCSLPKRQSLNEWTGQINCSSSSRGVIRRPPWGVIRGWGSQTNQPDAPADSCMIAQSQPLQCLQVACSRQEWSSLQMTSGTQ